MKHTITMSCKFISRVTEEGLSAMECSAHGSAMASSSQVDRWLHHRLPSTAPPGLIDTPQRGVRRVARGATPGERGRGAGFHHDKNSLNLMPLTRRVGRAPPSYLLLKLHRKPFTLLAFLLDK